MLDRHTMTHEERMEEEEIQRSLKTSTYLDDNFWERVHKGVPVATKVPNYKQATQSEAYSRLASESEGEGEHMSFGGIDMSDVGKSGGQQTFQKTGSVSKNKNSMVISKNQMMAIKKYPALIDLLGQEEGDKIAADISGQLNIVIANKLSKNAKEANENAVECNIDRHNFRQYFRGPDWVCKVTASGPFKGDEVIYYSRDRDVACVLKRIVTGEKKDIKYADISSDFQIIYEAAYLEPEIDIEGENNVN